MCVIYTNLKKNKTKKWQHNVSQEDDNATITADSIITRTVMKLWFGIVNIEEDKFINMIYIDFFTCKPKE